MDDLCLFLDNTYIEKLVALENSIESLRDKQRNFTPAPPMIGHNCKKMKPVVSLIADSILDIDDEEDDDDAPSQLNDAMIEDHSGDQSDHSEIMDVRLSMDEVSSEDMADS